MNKLEVMKVRADELEQRIMRNAQKNHRIWIETGDFDADLIRVNNRLTKEFTALSAEIRKAEGYKIGIPGDSHLSNQEELRKSEIRSRW